MVKVYEEMQLQAWLLIMLGSTGMAAQAADVDNCAWKPCVNMGTCIDLVDDYMCNCPIRFTGKNCESWIHDCAEGNPCVNGGKCIEWFNQLCECPAGFEGYYCQYKRMYVSDPRNYCGRVGQIQPVTISCSTELDAVGNRSWTLKATPTSEEKHLTSGEEIAEEYKGILELHNEGKDFSLVVPSEAEWAGLYSCNVHMEETQHFEERKAYVALIDDTICIRGNTYQFEYRHLCFISYAGLDNVGTNIECENQENKTIYVRPNFYDSKPDSNPKQYFLQIIDNEPELRDVHSCTIFFNVGGHVRYGTGGPDSPDVTYASNPCDAYPLIPNPSEALDPDGGLIGPQNAYLENQPPGARHELLCFTPSYFKDLRTWSRYLPLSQSPTVQAVELSRDGVDLEEKYKKELELQWTDSVFNLLVPVNGTKWAGLYQCGISMSWYVQNRLAVLVIIEEKSCGRSSDVAVFGDSITYWCAVTYAGTDFLLPLVQCATQDGKNAKPKGILIKEPSRFHSNGSFTQVVGPRNFQDIYTCKIIFDPDHFLAYKSPFVKLDDTGYSYEYTFKPLRTIPVTTTTPTPTTVDMLPGGLTEGDGIIPPAVTTTLTTTTTTIVPLNVNVEAVLSNGTIVSGESLTMVCSVSPESSSTPTLYAWSFYPDDVGGRTQLATTVALEIAKVDEDNSGMYECAATRSGAVGKDRRHVKVVSKPSESSVTGAQSDSTSRKVTWALVSLGSVFIVVGTVTLILFIRRYWTGGRRIFDFRDHETVDVGFPPVSDA